MIRPFLTRRYPAGALLAVAAVLAASAPVAAQRTAVVRVGEDRPLETAPAGAPLSEPHLSAHPTDPDHLVVAAMVVEAVRPSRFDCALFSSRDGGATWSRHDLGLSLCGNAWTTILPDHTALVAALGPRAELRLYRSVNGGRSWPTPPLAFGAGYDYPKVVSGPGDHVFLVAARGLHRAGRQRFPVMVARSADGGASFSDTTHLQPSDLVLEAQLPAVLSDGRLLVPYTEHHDLDHGPLVPARSWLLESRDGGRTFSSPRLLAEGCDQRAGWAYLLADPGPGPHRDRLYWLCVLQGRAGVHLRHSDDAGRRWSEWVRVDRDGAPGRTGLPAIAVNREGTVGIAWLARDSTPVGPCDRLLFAASVDGGASFQPPVPVSRERSCPAADPRNAAAHARRSWGGDYIGLAAAADGRFHAVWSDARDGVYRLRHARVVVERGD